MNKILKFILSSFVCFSFILNGCSKVDENKETEKKIIGKKIEGENVYIVNIINSTDKNIIEFSIKSNFDEYCNNMLSEDFIPNEERVLYYDANKAIEESKKQNDSEMETYPDFTIHLKFDDESEFELHSFPFDDVETVEIKMEDEIVFIEYNSIQQDKLVSTKDAELKIKSDKENSEDIQESVDEQNEPINQDSIQYPDYDYAQDYESVQEQNQVVVQPPVSGSETSNEGCLGDDVDTW